MDISGIDKSLLETIIRRVIEEKLGSGKDETIENLIGKHVDTDSGIASIKLPAVQVNEENRMDTGRKSDVVYTKDVFTLKESPRLGCGIMEMRNTTFDWTLNYDEIDYIIEGRLDVITDGRKISAGPGELIFIPKGSKIQFSVEGEARFLYVTYPADWQAQA